MSSLLLWYIAAFLQIRLLIIVMFGTVLKLIFTILTNTIFSISSRKCSDSMPPVV